VEVGFSSLARGHGLRGDGVLCRVGVGVGVGVWRWTLEPAGKGEEGRDMGKGEADAWIGPRRAANGYYTVTA
jgi:hypothetical protein